MNGGVLVHEPEALRDYIVGAHRAGWTVATHAIGDRAITHALDAIEHAQSIAPRPDVRHRIEHFALSDDLYSIPAEAIADQEVTTTVVGREVVFER